MSDAPDNTVPDTAIVCPGCERAGSAVAATRRESHRVRGRAIEVDCTFRRCTACGAEFEHDGDPDWRVAAFAAYREQAGLLQPEVIRSWRRDIGLSQGEVTALLGWGEATLGRYETGSLQSEAHDRQLRELMSPADLLERIIAKPDAVATHKQGRLVNRLRHEAVRERLEDVLRLATYDQGPDTWNGQQTLDLRRLVAAILILAADGEFKTKFNKLMFYADFTHFRRHGQSVTGLHYARLPHGPVPDDYQALIAALEESRTLEVQEVDFGDGYVGEKLVPRTQPEADVLTAAERDTLDRVKRYFQGWTSKRIREVSHEEAGWLGTANGKWISYDYAQDLRLKIE